MLNVLLPRLWAPVIPALVLALAACDSAPQEDTRLKSLIAEQGVLLGEIVEGNLVLDNRIAAVISSTEEISVLIESNSLTDQQAEAAIRKATFALNQLNEASEDLLALDTESMMQEQLVALNEIGENTNEVSVEELDTLMKMSEQLVAWAEETEQKGAIANLAIETNKSFTELLVKEARNRKANGK